MKFGALQTKNVTSGWQQV